MKIRKYQKKNKEKIEKFTKNILEEIFGKRDSKFKINLDKKTVLFVAKNKNKINGTIALKRIYTKQGRLKWMYVDRKYHGKGLAQRLYNKIINYCKLNNINKIYLTTYPKMRAAQKFYQKQGFKQTNKRYKDKRKQFVLELK